MKYVVRWTLQAGITEEGIKRAVDLWTQLKPEPGVKYDQMLVDTSGMGGFNIVEIDTDDPRTLSLDALKLLPYIECSIHPVIEMADHGQLAAEAIEYRASIPR